LQFHAAIVDSIRGIRDLSAFGRIGQMRETLEATNARVLDALHSSLQKNALAEAAGQFVTSLVFISSLALLVGLVRSGKIDGVVLATWALLIQCSFEAFLPMPLVFRYWEEARDAACRLFSFIPPQPIATSSWGQPPIAPFHLHVDKLRFSYAGKQTPALDQISFDLPPGKRLAIVGASGSGKSSLISILAGLQTYDSGNISINGINVNMLAPATLQDIFGVVLQHDYLFHATIADNLRLARPTASDQELWQALDQVFLADTFHSLPDGLETRLGNDGHGLSGGERRRLSLARLLLKNPKIMLLDEPTAGLDPHLAGQLLEFGGALLAPDRTVLLATHQFTGLEHMDEILVLDHGRIVERGCLKDLLTQQGYFYQLWLWQQDRFEYPFIR
jgi:ATP-binding cassette subfamily C protein CydC